MQDAPKAVWSIPYVSVAFFFSNLKQNFIAYRSSEVSSRPDCIFEIHQLWQSGFSSVYSNFCCNCSFEPEIIKIGPSSQKMYSNNIMNVQESTTIVNACSKTVWKPIEGTMYIQKKDLILNNAQWLTCYKTQANQSKISVNRRTDWINLPWFANLSSWRKNLNSKHL